MPKSDARSLITFFGYNSTGINVKFKFTLSLVSNPAFVDGFLFPYRQRSLLQKEFAMTMEDTELSSTALGNDPYKRYSLFTLNGE